MSAAAVENPLVPTESKSARKKKAKAEAAAANGPATAIPEAAAKDSSQGQDTDGTYESPYIRELQKNIRSITKKLQSMHKTDAVIAENPDASLEDLVAQKKINQDQKASALKKPQLQGQLQQYEEQISQYKKFDAEYQTQLQSQRSDLESKHAAELDKVKEDTRLDAMTVSATEVRKKLLVFSQFLRAAAAKRNNEDQAETDENKAFEGALLLVYGGDQTAVDTAVAIIEGSEEEVPNIEGTPLPIKYSQIKQASIDHAPFQAEETWVDQVAEANATAGEQAEAAKGAEAEADNEQTSVPQGSDPTVANAGLTELDTKTNGVPADTHDTVTSPVQAGTGDAAGNLASNDWDTKGASATAGAETGMDESYEMIPRPNDEVDTPAPASAAPVQAEEQKSSWADAAPDAEPPSGNQAGESWDLKPAGDQSAEAQSKADTTTPATTTGWAESTTEAAAEPVAATDADGFSEVAGRHRGGRGGYRGRGGDGEGRGRGRGRGGYRGDRGDGEHRGRGRGGYRGARGDGEGRGEYRGRGGRARGPRGEGQPARS